MKHGGVWVAAFGIERGGFKIRKPRNRLALSRMICRAPRPCIGLGFHRQRPGAISGVPVVEPPDL